MKNLLIVLVLTPGLLPAWRAWSVHRGCPAEAQPRTDHADFGCDQLPPPPVAPPGRS